MAAIRDKEMTNSGCAEAYVDSDTKDGDHGQTAKNFVNRRGDHSGPIAIINGPGE